MNISGGGICFTSDQEIKPNTVIALDLESDAFSPPHLAHAEVVWCNRTHQAYDIGTRYRWTGEKNDDAQRAIANYIATITKTEDGFNPVPTWEGGDEDGILVA